MDHQQSILKQWPDLLTFESGKKLLIIDTPFHYTDGTACRLYLQKRMSRTS